LVLFSKLYERAKKVFAFGFEAKYLVGSAVIPIRLSKIIKIYAVTT